MSERLGSIHAIAQPAVIRRRSAIVALLALLACIAATAPAPATAAAQPCWKRLVNDWYDGRIDRTYPVSCYREAIRNLPRDVDEYSSAREDIQRALQQAIRVADVQEDDPVPPETTPDEGSGGGGGGGPSEPPPPAEEPTTDPTGEPRSEPVPDEGGALGEAIKTFRPETADTIPLPLIVLAGLAGVLLAGAGASFLARRYQARRDGVSDGSPPS
jgi:hypothetical protein